MASALGNLPDASRYVQYASKSFFFANLCRFSQKVSKKSSSLFYRENTKSMKNRDKRASFTYCIVNK
jgi:hypothetical protein